MVVIVTQTRTCDELLKGTTAALAALSTFAGSPGSQGSPEGGVARLDDKINGGQDVAVSDTSLSQLSSGAAAGVNRVNQCKYSAFWSAVTNTDTSMTGPMELKPGESFFSGYHVGAGVSEKYTGKDVDQFGGDIPVVQLEYKLGNPKDLMYYDLSFIDCGATSATNKGPCPFKSGGYLITFSWGDNNQDCKHLYCPHEDDPNQVCRTAYEEPDDVDTRSCTGPAGEDFWNKVNTTITFCPSDEQLDFLGAESDSDDGDPGDSADGPDDGE